MVAYGAADAALTGSQLSSEGFHNQTGPFVLVEREVMLEGSHSLSQVLLLTSHNILLHSHKMLTYSLVLPRSEEYKTVFRPQIAVLKAEVSFPDFHNDFF